MSSSSSAVRRRCTLPGSATAPSCRAARVAAPTSTDQRRPAIAPTRPTTTSPSSALYLHLLHPAFHGRQHLHDCRGPCSVVAGLRVTPRVVARERTTHLPVKAFTLTRRLTLWMAPLTVATRVPSSSSSCNSVPWPLHISARGICCANVGHSFKNPKTPNL